MFESELAELRVEFAPNSWKSLMWRSLFGRGASSFFFLFYHVIFAKYA